MFIPDCSTGDGGRQSASTPAMKDDAQLKHDTSMKVAANVIGSLFVGAGIASAIVIYLAGYPFAKNLFNSDALYLPTLMRDLLADGGRIQDWYLTPAPYFFPDYPLFFIAYLAAPTAYLQFAVFAALQILALLLALFILAKCAVRRAWLAACLITLAFVWFAVGFGEPFVLLLTSAYHYGAFICALVLVAMWMLVIRQQPGPTRYGWLLVACAIAFLATLSDNIFIVQASVPFLAANICFDIAMRRLAFGRMLNALAIVIASFAGALSYRFVVTHDTRYPIEIGLAKAGANLADLYSISYKAIATNMVYQVILIAYVGIVIWTGARLFTMLWSKSARASMGEDGRWRLFWLCVFSLFSICSTIAVETLVKSLPVREKYLIAAFSWPVVIVILWGAYTRLSALASLALSAVFVSMLGYKSYGLATTKGLDFEFYPAELACLDDALRAAGAQNGIAQYWDAKEIQSFSRLRLHIAPYFDGPAQFRWITPGRYFRDRYDFAIISEKAPSIYKISREALSKFNGAPEREVRCADRSLLIYGKDQMKTGP